MELINFYLEEIQLFLFSTQRIFWMIFQFEPKLNSYKREAKITENKWISMFAMNFDPIIKKRFDTKNIQETNIIQH